MRVFTFLLVLLWSHAALATNTLTASVSPATTEVGGTVRYEVTATTQSRADIRLSAKPDFGELEVLQQMNMPSFVNINGNAQRSVTYIWVLRAPKIGELTIRPPKVVIGDEELEANAVRVAVVEQGKIPKTKTKNDQIFVTTELTPTRKHYVGEQISLIYQLFVDARLMDIQPHPPDEPSLDEFWIEDLSQHTAGNRQTQAVNGRLMQKATLRAYALFPIKAGRTEIEPLKLKVVQGGFFRREQSVEVESEPLMLDIQPLPPGAPLSFYEGNVGQWTFSVTGDQKSVQVGRSVNIRLTVKGEGLSNRIRIPELPPIEGVRMLNPIENTSSEIRNLRLFGERRKEIALLPLEPGTISIPPIEFSWFDPTTATYKTQQSDPLTIEVAPGEAPPEPQEVVSSRIREDAKSDDALSGLLTTINSPRKNDGDAFVLSDSLAWRGLVAFALLGILGLLAEPLVRRTLIKRAPLQERKRQRKELLMRIRTTQDHEHLALEVRQFLTNILDVPKGNLVGTRIQGALIKSSIFNEAEAKIIGDLLHWCDEKRFAPDKTVDEDFANRRNAVLGILEKTPTIPPVVAVALFVLIVLLIPQPLFADGLHAFDEGRFDEAKTHFEEDVRQTDSAIAHHNLALTHIKLEDWGRARLHLEQASLRSPFDGKIRSDLETVSKIVRLNAIQQTRVGRVLEGDDLLFWWRAASKISANSLSFAVTLFLILTIAGLLLARTGRSGRTLAVAATMALATVACVWVARAQLLELKPAVILAETPVLRSGPSNHAAERKDVKGMTTGTLLRVTEVRGNWVKLALSEEDSAWIETPQIGWVR